MSAPPAKLILLTAASDFKNLFNSKTTTTLYPTNISNFWQHELKQPKITVKAEKRVKKIYHVTASRQEDAKHTMQHSEDLCCLTWNKKENLVVFFFFTFVCSQFNLGL